MMAEGGSNGDDGPKSTTKPMSLPVLFHVIVVPGLTQTRALPLAFGVLAVAEAALAVRRTSIEQGSEAEPQVFSPVHICAVTLAGQVKPLPFWAIAPVE